MSRDKRPELIGAGMKVASIQLANSPEGAYFRGNHPCAWNESFQRALTLRDGYLCSVNNRLTIHRVDGGEMTILNEEEEIIIYYLTMPETRTTRSESDFYSISSKFSRITTEIKWLDCSLECDLK